MKTPSLIFIFCWILGISKYISITFILGITYSISEDGNWETYKITVGPDFGYSQGVSNTELVE